MFDVIVTRHQGLVDYIIKSGLAAPDTTVVIHATASAVRGKKVCGSLPHSLSCLTESFTEIPLALPLHKRGKELTWDEIKKYARTPKTYKIERVM